MASSGFDQRGDPASIEEVRLTPLLPGATIAFSVLFFLIGAFITSPLAVGGGLVPGGAIMVTSLAAGAAAGIWFHGRPVLLRFTPEALELPTRPDRIVWAQIAAVEVRRLMLWTEEKEYVCLRLHARRDAPPTKRLFQAAQRAVIGDWDVVLDEASYAWTAEQIVDECRRRMC